ncbi:uncharacterized protein [Ptychodera flava]|uniref:uncharacterized protein n=1 Tax=Ptychodera flava TaxID=63121 RepID=UPI003969F2AD
MAGPQEKGDDDSETQRLSVEGLALPGVVSTPTREVCPERKVAAEDLIKILIRENGNDESSKDAIDSQKLADPQTWDLVRLVADLRLLNGLIDTKTMDTVVLSLMKKLQYSARFNP